MLKSIDKSKKTKMAQEKIPFKDWQKLDLRVGRIVKVEEHPKADKLYLLEVDLGSEKRKLVAGLKQYYKPEELENKLCVVFTNLEPATIRGIESEGMILAAVNSNRENVIIIEPEKDIELGSKIE
jgi:methionyl-tRNA synthetase